MEVEEVAMKPLSTEKSQKIIAVEQKLKYHTFPSLKTKGGITNQIICIISLNLCQLSIGFGLGFSAISIPQIKVAKSQRIFTFSHHIKKNPKLQNPNFTFFWLIKTSLKAKLFSQENVITKILACILHGQNSAAYVLFKVHIF